MTPLESPCCARTSLVATRSEKTCGVHKRGTRLVQPPDVRQPPAEHDDVRIENVHDGGQGARQTLLVPFERRERTRLALRRERRNLFAAVCVAADE